MTEELKVERKEWTLTEWNSVYSRKITRSASLPAMTHEEITVAIAWLKSHNYPNPADCPRDQCPKVRPACMMGVCRIAVGMCGDF